MKPEAALHSKLTVAAAVQNTLMTNFATTKDIGKMMLLKVYNKMDSYREVGVPEAISHLLDYPDHYTDMTFINIHTTHLLNHIKQFLTPQNTIHNSTDNQLDSEIIVNNDGRLSLASIFIDYTYQGPFLKDYCLYDYCRLIYKDKNIPGITFFHQHPQYTSHCQILRRSSTMIPTLLGNLLFLNKASEKETEREDYYSLITALFFPWTYIHSLKSDSESWQNRFHDHESNPSP